MRKGSKSCWQKKRIYIKQLKSQETTGKTSRNTNYKAEREIKESWTVPQVSARRRRRSGAPGNARGAPTEHFQQKYIYKYVYIPGMYYYRFY